MAFDKDKPASGTSLRNSNPEILANQAALETALDADHDFTTGSTQTGRHNKCTFLEAADIGTGAVGVPILGAQTAGGKAELVFTDEDDNDVQLTKAGDLYASANIQVVGTTALGGSATLAAGADLIGSATSDITINTNKFTVAGATGNTVIAGTLGVTGVATLGDSSQMATSAAPTADADLANKKYADDITKGDSPTANDSESNAMLVAHAYLAQTSGFVNAYQDSSQDLFGFVGDTDDPAGAGLQVTQVSGSAATGPIRDTIMMFVPNGKYFEVTRSGADTPQIIWTPLVTGGGAPIDQD